MNRQKCSFLVLTILTLAASSFLAGCKNSNVLSTSQEVGIGKSASSDIEKQYRVDTTSADAKRVARIGERLLIHTDRRPNVPYTFKVLDMKEVNAVSLPGGPIYVYRGLLDMAGDDDDALATVMAHEIGHINARHAAKQISQQLEANMAISLLLKGNTAQNLAGLGANLLSLNYSRDDEYEADRRGLSYAYKAGYDPHGMIRFFRKLQTMEKGSGSPEFLRTHPVTKSRIDRAEKLIETQDFPYGQ